MDTLLAFLNSLAGLVPAVVVFAPLIAFVVDTIKRFKWLPDTYAPLASGVLNLLAYAAVFFATDAQKAQFPSLVAALLAVAPFFVSLVAGVLTTPIFHDLLTNVGIGFSHTPSLGSLLSKLAESGSMPVGTVVRNQVTDAASENPDKG